MKRSGLPARRKRLTAREADPGSGSTLRRTGELGRGGRLKSKPWRPKRSTKARNDAASFNADRTGAEVCAARDLGGCAGRIEHDHVRGRAVRPDLRGDPGNGEYLCARHHRLKTERDPSMSGYHGDGETYEAANRDPMAKIARQLGVPLRAPGGHVGSGVP